MQHGTLVWFDATSGEGCIQVEDRLLYVNYTCISGIAKNGYAYPTPSDQVLLGNLKAGDKCKVTIYTNLYSERIETAEFDLISVAA
jgi:cold shock CspA family protein